MMVYHRILNINCEVNVFYLEEATWLGEIAGGSGRRRGGFFGLEFTYPVTLG